MSIVNPLRFYLINFPGETVFTGLVNGTPTDPYISIPFDTGVTGSFGLPLEGMTVWFGSTSGGQERGQLRLRSISGVASGTLTVAESDDVGPQIQNNDFITIKNEFRLWPKYPRFLQQGQVVTIFEDYDTAFTNQTQQWRPKAVAGPPGFAVVEGGQAQISFVGDRSQASAPGATISSYLWTARDSTEGTSTSQGTEASPVVFTWTSPGRYLVTLTVTDSNGNTDTQHTWAIIETPDNLQVSFIDFDVAGDNHDFNQGGGEMSFTVPRVDGGIDVFPEESMVMLVSVGTITTATGSWPFRTNVHFSGWILSDSVRQNPETGDISFRAATVDAIMKNLSMFPVSLSDVAAAVNWTQALSLTADRAALFLYLYRSTLGLMTPIVFSGYTQLIRRQDFGPTDLYSQVQNELLRSIHGAGRLVCTHQGVIYHEIDHNIKLTSERATVTSRKLLHKGIWVNDVSIEETQDYAQPVRQVKMSGIHYPGGQVEDICPLFSEAPGDAPKVYGKEANFDRLIVVSQSDLNSRSGLQLARLNERYKTYRMTFINDGSFITAPQELFPANIESTDNNREIAYTGNLIPRRISRQFNHLGGYFTVSVDFEPETTGPAGVSVDMPCGPPDQVLPDQPDPPSAPPGLTALVAGTTGTSFYYAPGTGQTWQRRVAGLADPGQLGFLDVLPDPWSNFKQGYNPDKVIVWGSGRGFLVRSKDTGQSWTSRGDFITPQGWPDETAPDISEIDIAKVDMSIFAEDELYGLMRWRETGAYHGAVVKTTDGFDYDWFNLTGSAQVRPLGMSLDRGNGQCLYVTTWEDEPTGTLYLRQYNTSDMSLAARYDLAIASASEIDARSYYATPFNRNAQASEVYVYGNMLTPQGFTGTVQVLQNTAKGATGSYSIVENTWGADVAGSFGADTDSNLYGVRVGDAAILVDPDETLVSAPVGFVHDIAKANETTLILLFEDSTDIRAVAADISGETVTLGSEIVLNSFDAASLGLAYLEDNKVIALYEDDNAGELYASVLTLTGLTLTQGAEKTVRASGAAGSQIAAVNSTTAVAVYRASSQGRGTVLSISGTTITVNSEDTWTTSSVATPEPVKVGNDIMLVCRLVSNNRPQACLLYNITTAFDASSLVEIDTVLSTYYPAEYNDNAIVLIYKPSGSAEVRLRVIQSVADAPGVFAATAFADADMSPNGAPGIGVTANGKGFFGYNLTAPSASGHTRDFSISSNLVTIGDTDSTWDTGTDSWVYRSARLTNSLFGLSAAVTDLYLLFGLAEGEASFWHGNPTMSERFTLPFSSVRPAAMTLDGNLGRVVIASDATAGVPIIYSDYPYPTGTATATGYPTGTSTQAIKWV